VESRDYQSLRQVLSRFSTNRRQGFQLISDHNFSKTRLQNRFCNLFLVADQETRSQTRRPGRGPGFWYLSTPKMSETWSHIRSPTR